MATEKHLARDLSQVRVRLTPELLRKLEDCARKTANSINAEISRRLVESFDFDETREELAKARQHCEMLEQQNSDLDIYLSKARDAENEQRQRVAVLQHENVDLKTRLDVALKDAGGGRNELGFTPDVRMLMRWIGSAAMMVEETTGRSWLKDGPTRTGVLLSVFRAIGGAAMLADPNDKDWKDLQRRASREKVNTLSDKIAAACLAFADRSPAEIKAFRLGHRGPTRSDILDDFTSGAGGL